MTAPSAQEATAAARRIQEPYGQSYARHMDDARLLAAFVLAGTDTERLRGALESAANVAGHLLDMIPQQTWRDEGGDDGQGHYEGDYRAASVAEDIRAWKALAEGGV